MQPHRPTAFEHARAIAWPQRRPTAIFIRQLSGAITAVGDAPVAVAAGVELDAWRSLFGSVWPGVDVQWVHQNDDASQVHARLAAAGPLGLVMQAADTDAVTQAQLFQRLFFHLAAEGTFLTPRMVPLAAEERDVALRNHGLGPASGPWGNEDPSFDEPIVGDLWDLVSEAQAARLRDFSDHLGRGVGFRDVRGLGRHLERVQVLSKMLRIRNGMATSAKLTEAETDMVLALRPETGEETASLPATDFEASNSYRHNLDDDPYFVPHWTAPKVTLRRYTAPVCSRGQVVASGNLLMSDTFRHHLAPRMVNIYVEESAPRFGYVRRDVSAAEPLPGAWFNLDSEWPGHFGHTLTELIGRMWAWDVARRERPDLRCLMTLQHDRDPMELATFELELLSAFGIDEKDVHVFDRPCRPEVLYSATSMFSLPDYVHPDLRPIWRRVGDHLADQAPPRERPRRIFCTRDPALKRACRNTAEVEELFRSHGFEVVRPELHSVSEQVAMFRAAEAVGGFGGSALFTAALCSRPIRLFTVAPTSYTARNEHLIAAALGHDLVSAWSRPEIDHPAGGWTQEAFASSFTFDMAEEGVFLKQELTRLGSLD